MKELHDVERALLDVDGSCRDLNFENPTWDGATELVRNLDQSFEEHTATDFEGHSIDGPIYKKAIEAVQKDGQVHLTYNLGSGMVKHIQVFICREDDGSPFVELTFFPQDVVRTENLKSDFIEWANNLRLLLRAERYYCRYENASWQFGDTSSTSGVFIVSN